MFSRAAFLPTPYVTVVGAVRNPGRVPYRDGMTMRDLVLLANGVTEDADLREAEIARREVTGDPGTLATTIRVPLDSSLHAPTGTDGVAADSNRARGGPAGVPDVVLQPYDNVLIMRQTGWELQRLVYLTGQVKHPGRYALLNKTERLSDLIQRAGGLTDQAYAGGVQFYRAYGPGRRPVNDRPPPIGDTRRGAPDSLHRSYTERVGIDLPQVLKNPKFRDNIILTGGDSVHIPEYNPIVLVDGAVNAPGPVPYSPGKSLDWYVNSAGGYTQTGDTRHAYVTQPNGKREGVKRRAVFADDVPRPNSGAIVFVPTKVGQEQPSNVLGNIGTIVQVLGGLVTAIVVARRL